MHSGRAARASRPLPAGAPPALVIVPAGPVAAAAQRSGRLNGAASGAHATARSVSFGATQTGRSLGIMSAGTLTTSRTNDSVVDVEIGPRAPAPGAEGQAKYCSFDINGACKHALATRQCLHCQKYDSTGRGYYCDRCWVARHPWWRSPHEFVYLLQTPPPPPPPPVKNKIAAEVAHGALALLDATRASNAALGHDMAEKSAALSRAAGKCDDMMRRVTTMLLQLRDDEWRRQDHAARLIQSLFHRHKGRRLMQTAMRLLWGKVLDPATGHFYYINRATKRTQWEQPKIFGKVVDVAFFPRVLAGDLTEDSAARMIQGCWRRGRARSNIKIVATQVYRRVIDKGSGRIYYYNMLTRAAQWNKPKMLMGFEPPFYDPRDDKVAIADAAVLIQCAARRFVARRRVIHKLCEAYERVWDPASGRHFYYSKVTGNSRWSKPLAAYLPPFEIPDAPAEEEAPAGRHWSRHTPGEPWTIEQAATTINSLIRMYLAQIRVRRLLASVWHRVYDAEWGAYYYFQARHGISSWYKPRMLVRFELDLPPEQPEDLGDLLRGAVGPDGVALYGPEGGPGGGGGGGEEEHGETFVTVPDNLDLDGEDGAARFSTAHDGVVLSPGTGGAAGQASASTTRATAAATSTAARMDTAGMLAAQSSTGAGLSGTVLTATLAGTAVSAGGRPIARLSFTDILKQHWNRLTAYYAAVCPERQDKLTTAFERTGTRLWQVLEARYPGTTAAYTRGLQYLTQPYLYPGPGCDIAQPRLEDFDPNGPLSPRSPQGADAEFDTQEPGGSGRWSGSDGGSGSGRGSGGGSGGGSGRAGASSRLYPEREVVAEVPGENTQIPLIPPPTYRSDLSEAEGSKRRTPRFLVAGGGSGSGSGSGYLLEGKSKEAEDATRLPPIAPKQGGDKKGGLFGSFKRSNKAVEESPTAAEAASKKKGLLW